MGGLAIKIVFISLCSIANGFVQLAGNREIKLSVAFFALAEHFEETPEELEQELKSALAYFPNWTQVFRNDDYYLNVDYTLTILNNSAIYYPYWVEQLASDDVFNGVQSSAVVNNTYANMKILLLPDLNSQDLMAGYAGSVSGVALQDPFGLLNEIEQFAVAKIQTRQSFIKNNVPNINGKYGLNRYKYNPAMYYISPLFTREVRRKYFRVYGDENGKGEYLLKLAEDLWTNRTETDKMKNIAIAVHQFGHLLGATECMALGPWDDTNIMCGPAGTELSSSSSAQIYCRIVNNYFDRRSHTCQPREAIDWWWRRD